MLPGSLAIAIAVGLGATAPSSDTSSSDDAASEREREADAEIKAARAAASSGDYESAVTHFESALALRPSAGLHYNIAVCHHRRWLELDPKSDAWEPARKAAVDAYNAYLIQATNAEDRYHVAQTVSELGGRPAVIDEWMVKPDEPAPTGPPQLRDTDEDPPPAPEDPPPEPEETVSRQPPAPPEPAHAAAPPESTKAPVGPRARIGGALALGFVGLGKQRASSDVETLPSLGAVLRGGAFITERRELNLGAELGVAVQPSNAERRHRLTRVHGALTVDWGRRVASDRLELGVGGLTGLVLQSLRTEGTTTAVCPEHTDGDVSGRSGFLAAARANVLVMLGPKRNHELGLRVGPGVAVFASGSRGDTADTSACSEATDAFSQFGLNGPNLVLLADIGYAGRF